MAFYLKKIVPRVLSFVAVAGCQKSRSVLKCLSTVAEKLANLHKQQ